MTMLATTSCAVVPLQKEPGPPPRFNYVGHHGIPLAYGGGVCPVESAHSHSYPPTPKASYDVTDEGYAKENASFVPFFDPHPHHERTCFREGWHLHRRGPQAEGLVYDEEVAAHRAVDPTLGFE